MQKYIGILLATSLSVIPSPPAFAGAGLIIETIKAHVEQHQTQTRPLQTPRGQGTPALQTSLEQWVRSMLDSLTTAK